MISHEAALTKSLMAYARRQRCFVKKNHGSLYGFAGEPDLFLLIPVSYQTFPAPAFIEVKTPGNKPTPLQCKVMRSLQKTGAFVTWVDSLERFALAIEAVQSAPLKAITD